MKYCFFTCILMLACQITAQVGINTTTPIDQSSLHIEGPNTGVLINRVELLGRDDTTTVAGLAVASAAIAAEGLMVYNTAINGAESNAVKTGFYNWDGTSWVRLVNEDSVNDYTGWGDYTDTQFTSTSAGFVAANTNFFLPNNGGNTNESQKPIDIPTFYDTTTQRIIGRNGDGLNVVLQFKARPLTNNITTVTLSIDIGAPVGRIYTRDIVLSKGFNQEHFYLSSFSAYTLGTWEANGGRVIIRTNRNIEIYDIRYVLTRTHKAR